MKFGDQHQQLAQDEQLLLRDIPYMASRIESKSRSEQHELKLARSKDIVRARKAHRLQWRYPEKLPVSRALDDIANSVLEHQVTIISSGTGSGKSTQIPKRCLEMGFGIHGQIAHTQPRRIAARSIARRIAEETGTRLGQAVGSHVRFDKGFSEESRLKVMTDGILLEEIRHDPLLLQYDLLIIDEVHERSCNIDFLLGYISRIRERRPGLKIILMSATADQLTLKNRFSAHVVELSSKQFPVAIEYRPYDEEMLTENEAIELALKELPSKDDVLVFLPGEREILEAKKYLQGRVLESTEFSALFGRMSSDAQAAIFKPVPLRRVILATNVAETSVTIPGIRHVIDTGSARISRYNPRSKLLELPVSEISQAAAKQRAGRCGREAPGTCIRLYSEENFAAREVFTEPEILRTSLAGAILRCASLKLGKLGDFPLPDSPSDKLVRDGVSLLKEIEALNKNQNATRIGRTLAKLPVDPRLGRFLLAAAELGQYEQALTICAAVSVGDCRLRPLEKRALADAAHAQFAHQDSDLLSYLNLWSATSAKFAAASRGEARLYCQQNFLSYSRIRQWQDLRKQLHRLWHGMRLPVRSEDLNYKRIHQAFLVGFASLIGVKDEQGNYRGAHGVKFKIHPRSTVRERKPKYVACLERFETSSRFADVVAKIEPAWVIQAAPHLIKSSYSAPYWDRKRGKAYVFATRRLFGVVLGKDKRTAYEQIEPTKSRAMLIAHGLVKFELDAPPEFLRDNAQTINTIRDLEQKLRRQLIPGDEQLYTFFDERIPHDVSTAHSLRAWVSQDSGNAEALRFEVDPETRALAKSAETQYPDVITAGEYEFRVKYRFDPTDIADGMTIVIERELLKRLDAAAFDALCPGLLHEKILALVKALPKSARKKLSPSAEFASEVVSRVGQNSLEQVFARCFAEKCGENLGTKIAELGGMPGYLVAHVEVVDSGSGSQTRVSGDQVSNAAAQRFYSNLTAALKTEFPHADNALAEEEPVLFTRWLIKELPKSKETRIGTNRVVDYMAFADRGNGVEARKFSDASVASQVHQHGVARLATLSKGVRSRKRVLPGFEPQDILLMCSSLGLDLETLNEVRKAAYFNIMITIETPRTMDGFDEFMAQSASEAEVLAEEMSATLSENVRRAYRIKKTMSNNIAATWPEAYVQLDQQLRHLFSVHAFATLDQKILSNYQRYLAGIERRIERLSTNPSKDSQKANSVLPAVQAWQDLSAGLDLAFPWVFNLYYEIEELRLKYFAPELALNRKINMQALVKQIKAQHSVLRYGT